MLDKGLDQQGGSPPENGLGGEAPTHWLSFALVIDFDETEAAGVSEEKRGQTTRLDDRWTGEEVPQVGQVRGQVQQGMGSRRQGPSLCWKVAV